MAYQRPNQPQQNQQVAAKGKRPHVVALALNTKPNGETTFTEVGIGWKTTKGSISIILNALPVSGKLLIKKFEPKVLKEGFVSKAFSNDNGVIEELI